MMRGQAPQIFFPRTAPVPGPLDGFKGEEKAKEETKGEERG